MNENIEGLSVWKGVGGRFPGGLGLDEMIFSVLFFSSHFYFYAFLACRLCDAFVFLVSLGSPKKFSCLVYF